MASAPRFCTQCGNPLQEDDRFCGQCGQAVPTRGESTDAAPPEPPPPPPAAAAVLRTASEPPTPPPPAPRRERGRPARVAGQEPATPGEPVLGVVSSVQRRHGFLGTKADNYSIVVTPQRLVFAFISKPMMNDAIREANANAKAQGKGFFGVMAAQLRWLEVISARLADTPVDSIFQQYPGSFQINNNEVRRIRFYEVGGDEDSAAQPKVTFETTGGKLDYYLVGTSEKAARAVLAQTLMPAIR